MKATVVALCLSLATGAMAQSPTVAKTEGPPRALGADEARIVRFVYAKVLFYLERNNLMQERRVARRKAQQARAIAKGAPGVDSIRPAPGVPEIEISSIATGRLAAVLDRPHEEFLTVPRDRLGPRLVGVHIENQDKSAVHVGYALIREDEPLWPPNRAAGSLRDVLAGFDSIHGYETYATYDVRLRWQDIDRSYKAIALFGARGVQFRDLVLGSGMITGLLKEERPLIPTDHYVTAGPIPARAKLDSRALPVLQAATTPPACPAGTRESDAINCYGGMCCGLTGNCCALESWGGQR